MGTSVGTLSWDPHVNDQKYKSTFQVWAKQQGLSFDTPNYGEYNPKKTQFVIDSSGFSRDPKKVKTFLTHCASALEMHDVQGICVQTNELAM